jgi:hypothetical protein
LSLSFHCPRSPAGQSCPDTNIIVHTAQNDRSGGKSQQERPDIVQQQQQVDFNTDEDCQTRCGYTIGPEDCVVVDEESLSLNDCPQFSRGASRPPLRVSLAQKGGCKITRRIGASFCPDLHFLCLASSTTMQCDANSPGPTRTGSLGGLVEHHKQQPRDSSERGGHGAAGGHRGWPSAGGRLACLGFRISGARPAAHTDPATASSGPQVERHCTATNGGSFIPGPSRAGLFAAAVAAFSTELVSAPSPTGGCTSAWCAGEVCNMFRSRCPDFVLPGVQAPRTSTCSFTARRTAWSAGSSVSTARGSRARKRPSARRSSSQVCRSIAGQTLSFARGVWYTRRRALNLMIKHPH